MTILKTDKAQEIYFLLMEEGFNYKLARFITSQAAHETGNFSSKIYQDNNNIFGMKLALIRETTAKGEKNKHAYYDNIADCVKDYGLYWKSRKLPKAFNSIADFVTTLHQKDYFEAPLEEYKTGVEYFYKMYFGNGEQV